MRAAILGGGIGGLTMANALKRVGIDFDVYEQADELTEVGAGIGLSKGALDLLHFLELGSDVTANGSPIKNIYLADKALNIRRRLPANYNGVCIHRAVLIDILKSRLPPQRIHLSKRVLGIDNRSDYVCVRFSDGAETTAKCVIAADGINSIVRRTVFPNIPIRHINQTIWRGITGIDVPELLRQSYLEVWDERLRFLTVPINSEDTFWLAVKPARPGERDDPLAVRDELLHLFRNFHPTFRALVAHTDGFLRSDMADLGPPAHPWHQGRVVFIGDSIHATTPNLAQGGCQAMEDAVCLALCLKSQPEDLAAAYRQYQALRRPKVSFVVNTSWRFGVAAHSRNPLVYHIGRAFLERSPATIIARQERFLSDLSYLREVDPTGMLAAAR